MPEDETPSAQSTSPEPKAEAVPNEPADPLEPATEGNPLAEEYGLTPEQTKMFDLYL